MGYLISTHFLERAPDFSALRSVLPESLEPHIYKHSEHPVWAVDTLRSPLRHGYYFGSSTETRDVPIELPGHLDEVQRLYDALSKLKSASGLRRGFINLAELISKTLGEDVLSIFSDDDGVDLAMRTRAGQLQSIEGMIGDHAVSYWKGCPFSLEPIPEHQERRLHDNASRVFEDVFGVSGEKIGFGRWDPPENYGFEEQGTQGAPVPRGPTPSLPEPKPKGFSLRSLFGRGK